MLNQEVNLVIDVEIYQQTQNNIIKHLQALSHQSSSSPIQANIYTTNFSDQAPVRQLKVAYHFNTEEQLGLYLHKVIKPFYHHLENNFNNLIQVKYQTFELMQSFSNTQYC
ncbi:hypothetical protein [Piscirickettsia litoralis]|uniref:Uncharacterized protein n=1 Tax=Piscirickettsia litoralis TaxID=1891921 RepID=A0ABX3A4E7_9GAMM|nr:hypothetical protein [Piscirickettsia litoralis]ODN43395.1 hypothetical protein BGC07_11250 [Piscirickettsia litoralis]